MKQQALDNSIRGSSASYPQSLMLPKLLFCESSFPFTDRECARILEVSQQQVLETCDYFEMVKFIEIGGRTEQDFRFFNFWNLVELNALLSCSGSYRSLLKNISVRNELMDELAAQYYLAQKDYLLKYLDFEHSVSSILLEEVKSVSPKMAKFLLCCLNQVAMKLSDIGLVKLNHTE